VARHIKFGKVVASGGTDAVFLVHPVEKEVPIWEAPLVETPYHWGSLL
jgi:hypothetical protein